VNCVVVDALQIEPVSSSKFPANREINREFYRFRPSGPIFTPNRQADSVAFWLGVTPKVVYDLAKAGVIERGPARLFPLEESVRRYCAHLRWQTGVSP
jgi:hypothetical protein